MEINTSQILKGTLEACILQLIKNKEIAESSIYKYLEKELGLNITHSRREISFRYATEEEKIVKLSELASNYPDTPFFVGIMPITSYNNAIFLHNEVPGIKLSEEFLSRLEEVKDDKELCQKIALDESKKLIDVALKHFNGIYLITPFTRADLTVELIDYIETVKTK